MAKTYDLVAIGTGKAAVSRRHRIMATLPQAPLTLVAAR